MGIRSVTHELQADEEISFDSDGLFCKREKFISRLNARLVKIWTVDIDI